MLHDAFHNMMLQWLHAIFVIQIFVMAPDVATRDQFLRELSKIGMSSLHSMLLGLLLSFQGFFADLAAEGKASHVRIVVPVS